MKLYEVCIPNASEDKNGYSCDFECEVAANSKGEAADILYREQGIETEDTLANIGDGIEYGLDEARESVLAEN